MKPNGQFLKIISIILLLTACGAPPTPPVTASPAATTPLLTAPPPAPTATLPPSPTPTNTLTPTPSGPRAVVAEVINRVQAHAQAGQEWAPARQEMTIYLGGQVWAQEASTARLRLEQELIRVAPNTIFTFSQPDDQTLKVNLQQGQIWLNVTGLPAGSTLQVETNAASASVRGTRYSVRLSPAITETLPAPDAGAGDLTLPVPVTTTVSTWEGEVLVSAQGQEVTVGPGQMTTVVAGSPPTEPITMTVPERFLWLNAIGPGLDLQMPVSPLATELELPAIIYEPNWSWDGNLFAFYRYANSPRDGTTIIHLQDGSQQGVLSGAWAVFFNPQQPILAYDIRKGNSLGLCVQQDYSIILAGLPPDPAPVCVGDQKHHYGWPIWSPTGKHLIFYSDHPGLPEPLSLYAFSAAEEIAGWLETPWRDLYASWGWKAPPLLPAGNPVRFNLFRLNDDGRGIIKLTADVALFNHRQVWSADGEFIAYVRSGKYGDPGEVWVMDKEGGNARLIFDGIQKGNCRPAWSPDGQWIALPAQADNTLWLVRPDGSQAHPVPGATVGAYRHLAWSPSPTGWPLLYQVKEEGKPPATYLLPAEGAEPLWLGNYGDGLIWAPTHTRLALLRNAPKVEYVWSQPGNLLLLNLTPQLWAAMP